MTYDLRLTTKKKVSVITNLFYELITVHGEFIPEDYFFLPRFLLAGVVLLVPVFLSLVLLVAGVLLAGLFVPVFAIFIKY